MRRKPDTANRTSQDVSTRRGPELAIWQASFSQGGVNASNSRLALELARSGVPVDLVISCAQGRIVPQQHDRIRTVFLEAASPNFGRSIHRLGGYLLRERPKAIVVPDEVGYLVAFMTAVLCLGTKVWISARSTSADREETQIHVGSRSLTSMAAKLVYTAAEIVLRRFPEGFLTNSEAVAQELITRRRVDRKKVHVVHNVCVTGEFDGRRRVITNAVNHEPVILNVGRLAPRKDQLTLLKAFRLVREACNARLVILGEGPLRGELENAISSFELQQSVQMPGYCPEPSHFFATADVFVLCSRIETFGNALVEAMAYGCPVVSTNCTGPREILEEGKFGRLVPVGDSRALADAILQVLNDPPDPEMLQRRAAAFHAKNISGVFRKKLGLATVRC